MCLSARFKFVATLVVSLLGFALTLNLTEPALLDGPLAMQAPQR
ncbi:hypothetical protein [Pelomonas cellulosilytica]|nr:hypothetical protein [Pelomonas sp. P8]